MSDIPDTMRAGWVIDDPTAIILGELKDRRFRQVHIASTYRLAIIADARGDFG